MAGDSVTAGGSAAADSEAVAAVVSGFAEEVRELAAEDVTGYVSPGTEELVSDGLIMFVSDSMTGLVSEVYAEKEEIGSGTAADALASDEAGGTEADAAGGKGSSAETDITVEKRQDSGLKDGSERENVSDAAQGSVSKAEEGNSSGMVADADCKSEEENKTGEAVTAAGDDEREASE